MPPAMKKRRTGDSSSATEDGTLDNRLATKSLGLESVAEAQARNICKDALLSSKELKPIDQLLHEIKSIIDNAPDLSRLPIVEAVEGLRRRGIHMPFPHQALNTHANYQLAYAKPAYCNVIGSHALGTLIHSKDELTVELAICMPRSLFEDKDYLNYRYFHKRAYYLAVIAALLKESKSLNVILAFHYFDDNELRAELLIREAKKDVTRRSCFTIRVVPVLTKADAFPILSLGPSKCSIKKDPSTGKLLESTLPTPCYNSSILADATAISYIKFLNLCKSKCPSFRDACILGALWLSCRGFTSTISGGGFGAYEWSLLMGILLHTGRLKDQSLLSVNYSSLQIFRNTLQFLANRDLIEHPLIFGLGLGVLEITGLPMVLDTQTNFNVLYKMSVKSYSTITQEAQISCGTEKLRAGDRLIYLFLQEQNKDWNAFDACIQMHFPSSTSSFNSCLQYIDNVCRILSEGLGDRLRSLHVLAPESNEWAVDKMPDLRTSNGAIQVFRIGLWLHDSHSRRMVDHGPPIEDVEKCNLFRTFWGPRSELRRFANGQVTETLVWDKTQPILPQIVAFVFQRHLGLAPVSDYILVGNDVDSYVPGLKNVGLTTSSFDQARTAFENMIKMLRDLEGLPLHIKDISPTSSFLRGTAVYPITKDQQNNDKNVEVILGFETSQKWPDDLHLVQKSKVALLLKMSKVMQASEFVETAKVGLESSSSGISNFGFLDLETADRMTFRIRIFCDREMVLARQGLADLSNPQYIRREYRKYSLAFELYYIQLPLHHETIARMCQKLVFLSPAIRLVKKWVACHLLIPHVSEEMMEIITARCFLTTDAHTPATVFSAFMQTLRFLSQWDWKTEPLIVDFTGQLSNTQYATIHQKSRSMRQSDALTHEFPLQIFTIYDDHKREWLVRGPSKAIAARLTALAKLACTHTSFDDMTKNIQEMFTPSLGDYDIVILVDFNATIISGRWQKNYKNVDASHHKLRSNNTKNFKQFIVDIKSAFQDQIILFYDEMQCNLITAVWRGDVNRRIRTSYHPYSACPQIVAEVEEENKSICSEIEFVPNKTAIISELLRLGKGFVQDISWR